MVITGSSLVIGLVMGVAIDMAASYVFPSSIKVGEGAIQSIMAEQNSVGTIVANCGARFKTDITEHVCGLAIDELAKLHIKAPDPTLTAATQGDSGYNNLPMADDTAADKARIEKTLKSARDEVKRYKGAH
jgi:hypothetical protein